jgi:hypothetical protein
MNDDQTYLPTATYYRLVRQLEKLITNGPEMHGTDAQTEVATALGENAGIWPAGVLNDPLRTASAITVVGTANIVVARS